MENALIAPLTCVSLVSMKLQRFPLIYEERNEKLNEGKGG